MSFVAYKLITGRLRSRLMTQHSSMYTHVVAWQQRSATPFRLRHDKQKVQNSVVQRSDIEQATATMDSNCWFENSYLWAESQPLLTL